MKSLEQKVQRIIQTVELMAKKSPESIVDYVQERIVEIANEFGTSPNEVPSYPFEILAVATEERILENYIAENKLPERFLKCFKELRRYYEDRYAIKSRQFELEELCKEDKQYKHHAKKVREYKIALDKEYSKNSEDRRKEFALKKLIKGAQGKCQEIANEILAPYNARKTVYGIEMKYWESDFKLPKEEVEEVIEILWNPEISVYKLRQKQQMQWKESMRCLIDLNDRAQGYLLNKGSELRKYFVEETKT